MIKTIVITSVITLIPLGTAMANQSITTGNATSNTSVTNTGNSNHVSTNCGCVTPTVTMSPTTTTVPTVTVTPTMTVMPTVTPTTKPHKEDVVVPDGAPNTGHAL